MAKFCTKCGKKLEEGKKCSCSKVEVVKEETVTIGTNANEIVNSLIDIVKGIFVKPIDTIKKYSDDANMVLGFILIAITSLITGIMGYLFTKSEYVQNAKLRINNCKKRYFPYRKKTIATKCEAAARFMSRCHTKW